MLTDRCIFKLNN